MSNKFGNVKGRVAQAVYVVFAVASIGIFVGFLSDGKIVPAVIMCAGLYGVGWGIRWIVDGTSTSIFDYFLDTGQINRTIWQKKDVTPQKGTQDYLDWANREGRWSDRKDENPSI